MPNIIDTKKPTFQIFDAKKAFNYLKQSFIEVSIP